MILTAVGVARADAQCGGGGSIGQYGCWEQQIESSQDFYNGGAGNPYRDLTLRITFSSPGTSSFTQDAFWVGDTTNATTAKRFKVRAALRPGTWTWSIAGCTGTTGGQSCSSGTTWTPSSGAIVVYSRALPNALYSRGFPTQSSTGSVYQPLTYGDRTTRFFWAGDTAWSAPAFEIDALLHGGTRYWSTFLGARTPDSQYWPPPPYNHYAATAVLVAPAAHWSKANAADVFKVQPNCNVSPAVGSTAWNNVLWYPNSCSIPNPAYWDALDAMAQSATQADIVLLIAGLIHPLNLGSTYPTYPPPAEVARFSRYLAARMAGFAVMFSPGFDMPVSAVAADGTSTGRTLMDSSGAAVRLASPRTLVTAHLNGAALCSDYRSFATAPAPWMTWYLFQSGHALAAQGQSSDPCAGWQGAQYETKVQGALRRAIGLPTALAGYSSPTMPSVNGEGPYDNPSNQSTNYTLVDVRYRVRQAGNLSSLSGAQGFTYGMTPVSLWSNPGMIGLRPSETDMHALATRFRQYPGLPNRVGSIVNNRTAYDQRMALASNGSTVAIAYVPPVNPAAPTTNAAITISTSAFPGLGCSGTWTLRWVDPTGQRSPLAPSACSGTTQMTVTAPACTSTNHGNNAALECDWILTMTRTGATVSPGTPREGMPSTIDLWSEPAQPDDGTSAVMARIADVELPDELPGPDVPPESEPVVVSPSGLGVQEGARVATVPGGYVVVWHAEPGDGWMLGVYGQRLDGTGKLVGGPFLVNSTTELDQRDPAIAADPDGNVVVVWESYGEDGDLGGIFGQLFDSGGEPLGGEFAINATTAGHQARPQVSFLMDGGFAVAWTTEAIGDDPGAVSLRAFDAFGNAQSAEVRVDGDSGAHPNLADLTPTVEGGVALRWFVEDDGQTAIASYVQEFDAETAALGEPEELP